MLTIEQVETAMAAVLESHDIELAIEDGRCPVPASPWQPSIGEYHRQPSVSSSSLRLFMRDRQEYQRVKVWCEGESFSGSSSALNLGAAFGGYWLDRDEYEQRRVLLSPADTRKLEAMISAIKTAPAGTWADRIRRYLTTVAGRSEWSYRFIDQGSGIPCRIRCDRLVWIERHDILRNVELKTSAEPDLEGFRRAVRKWSYHHQLALQEQGLRVAFPGVDISSRWAFVSSTKPYRAAILAPDHDKLRQADAENRAALAEMAQLMSDPGDPLCRQPWGPRVLDWERAGTPETA